MTVTTRGEIGVDGLVVSIREAGGMAAVRFNCRLIPLDGILYIYGHESKVQFIASEGRRQRNKILNRMVVPEMSQGLDS